ncbi:hypothetical protein QMM95_07270 [Leptospira santarosai]|uniref:hypothetical protein n=1 Tax=Leptospira santarosai TaxID=28183 RepID=UPI0024AEAABD|nr:hypothetical protein [Leptospira santarosai]MDI7235888.1 hypothetical protein [Leptospira santarosai]
MKNESGLQTLVCSDILLESLPKVGFGKFALILSAFGVGSCLNTSFLRFELLVRRV